jgi:RNA polymerase sigma-70 factor (ECF subfamily)
MPDLSALLAYTALADQQAFAELYERTRAHSWTICRRMLGDEQLAEDAMQDAYVKIWHQAGSYRPHLGDAQAWLATVVRNACRDRLRALSRESAYLYRNDRDDAQGDPPDVADPRTPEAVLDARMSGSVEDCFEQLAARQRDLLTAAYVMGQTHGELARERGLPLGTVKTLIRRAVLALRACLGAPA